MKSAPADGPRTLTISIPLTFKTRGGRKTIISPTSFTPPLAKHDNALIKALARAHRWRRMIEQGQFASITEVAKAEKINQSYACRILRMTLLAPDIVGKILDGRQGDKLSINDFTGGFPVEWSRQREKFMI
jgi:hypothetical protein